MPRAHNRLDSELDGKTLPIADDITLYKRPWSDGLLVMLFLASGAACIYFSGAQPFAVQYVDFTLPNRWHISFPIPLYALLPTLLLVIMVHKTYNSRYVIAEDHVRAVQGLISLFLVDKRIDFENIRGVEVARSFYQRLTNLGDLVIGSSMHAGDELVMEGIHRPHFYRDILEARIRAFMHENRTGAKERAARGN